MRVIRDYQDGAVTQNYLDAAQHSSLAGRAVEAWSNWEIQFLVMASFSLQVFLLLSAPFRKRHRSCVLNGSLWVAYLMADYVATYLLGRLTLLVAVAGGDGGTRNELALFWAPFLLLHLGGQETITAFSMEDNTLWKRRVLDLAAQVAMAVYLVAKQWRGDRMLVAPMVLMFISGTVKYAERIWALRVAAVRAHRSSSMVVLEIPHVLISYRWRLDNLFTIICSEGNKASIEHILEAAYMEFPESLDFFMDVAPFEVLGRVPGDPEENRIKHVLMEVKSSKNVEWVLYKLVEMHLSLIHDFLYTKFGTVRFQGQNRLNSAAAITVLQWLGSLGLTSVALVQFARASRSSNNHHSGADVLISYILLVGAIVMEMSSIFIALVTSCWVGTGVVKRLHLHEGRIWSGKLPQYNMVDACIRSSGQTLIRDRGRVLRSSWETSTHVVVSPELRKLLLKKVFEVAVDLRRNNYWDFRRFQGQWAMWVANIVDEDRDVSAPGPAHMSLSASRIQEKNFVSSVFIWHLVTVICLMAGDGSGELTNPSKELSNYVIYLVAKRSVMVDSDGRAVLVTSQRAVQDPGFLDGLHQRDFIRRLREGRMRNYLLVESVTSIAHRVCVELFKIPDASARWNLIAAVWTEIICYMALNSGAAFHAKHLTTGGEFLTQVKMLLFFLRLC